MCRFTLAIDQQNVNVQCFSLNISKSGSLRLVGKRQKILRVLPTIVEIQEEGKEFQSEDQEKFRVGIQSCSVSEFSECGGIENQVVQFKSANVKTTNHFTKGFQQPAKHFNGNQRQIKTGDLKQPSQDATTFQGFGDFLPRDFVNDFDQNIPAEIGIKNYLEKKRQQCKKLNCREEEIREYNKNRGAEVQSWLHFFG